MTAHADSDTGSDDELDPDEPRTPLWLPLLGLCLFVAALAYVLVSQGSTPASAPTAAEPAAAEPAPSAPPPSH